MAALVRRDEVLGRLVELLKSNPVVAILGARQVGKSTLARQLAKRWKGPVTHFDLESAADRARLADPELALEGLSGLVTLDEIQLRPELFPAIRVRVDRPRSRLRVLVLGSAAPELLRQGAETLAGRIAFLRLNGFSLDEVATSQWSRLWLRGGFPRSFLAPTEALSLAWRRDFVTTFLERDLARLELGLAPAGLGRLWSMLAHNHGQLLNSSDLGRSLGVSHTTVRRYLDRLAGTFMVRSLPPWHENLAKRQVRSPKVYVADSGLLHSLLGIDDRHALTGHPKLGSSFEGFAIDQIVRRLGARPENCYFWGTYSGAELDLLVVQGGQRLGFEIKYGSAPAVTPSMRVALADLRLDRLVVCHAGEHAFPMGDRIRAVPLSRLRTELQPLR